MKWGKRLLLVLAITVLLFIGAAVLLVTLVDPNDYKQLIVEEVHKATGRELTIGGDIELSFFPWLGLRLGATELSNASGFGETPFARLQEAQVRVALLPLLKGEVRADTLKFKGLKVNLSKNQQGVSNWDDLVAKGEPQAEPQKSPSPEEDKPALALAIGGIDIQQAALHWQDAQSGTDVEISPFNLQTGALSIGKPFDLKLNLQAVNKAPQVTATINLQGLVTLNPEQQRYQIKDLKLDLEALGDTLPGGKLRVAVKTDIEADLQNQTASIAPLSIEALSIKLDGEVKATQLLETAQINGHINSEPFSLRKLFEALGQQPPPTSDPKVLSHSSLGIVFSANPDQATLSQLKLALDDTQITGKAGIKSFQKPHIDFDISVDDIDVDRYLPPQPAKPKQEPADTKPAPQPSTDDRIALPMETLRELDMTGQLRISKLKAANLRMSELQATLTAKNGLVELKPVKISLYKGHVESGVKIDARKDTPGFGVSTHLKNVAMGDLMHDLQQDKAYIKGTGNLSLDLNTQGNHISTLKKKLGGTLNLAITDGALRDRKLAAKLEAVIAFLKGRKPAQAGEEIIFEKLTGSAKVNDGVLRNDDLNLITALILAKGQGKVNLGNDTIDYRLSVALAGKDKNKKRFFVPITLKGPFTDLDYGLDLDQAAKQRLKEEIDEKKQETKEKIDRKINQKRQELEQKLQEKLKGKFKLF